MSVVDKRIRVGYQSGGKLILPTAFLGTHDLYSIKSDTKIKNRPNLMQAQDEAAMRYQILTGDICRDLGFKGKQNVVREKK